MTLLCLVKGSGWVFEEAVETAGDVALEAAAGFAGGLAFGDAPGEVVAAGLVVAGAGEHHGVQRVVGVAVAALVEPVPLLGLPRVWP